MFDFQSPLFLGLLAALPFIVFVQRRTTVIASKWRKRTVFLLRCAALLCAVLALASLHRTHTEQRIAVAFLIDTSDSIAPSEEQEAVNQINAAIAKLKPTDLFGVISFAREASILRAMLPKPEQPHLISFTAEPRVTGDATDILTSLKRALELLPDNYHRRIVLFSDGGHNAGHTSLEHHLPLFAASEVEIFTIPLQTIKDAIRIQELRLPNQVRKGQRFPVQAIVESDGSIPTVTATLYHNGVPMPEIEFPLQSGTNVLTFPTQQVSEARPHTYQLRLNVGDTILENNRAYSVVQFADKPHALYVERDLEYAGTLKTLLEENGFVVDVISASEMPTDLTTFQHYDVTILSNISADTVSTAQLNTVQRYVRDLGHGLVVIGGDEAFGPGGYTGTALERALPVDMTPRERKDAVALVFVIDTSGSMANYVGTQRKIDLAIEAIRAGIRNLKPADEAGVIGFNVDSHVISQLTSDHDMLKKAVGRLKPTGGTTMMAGAINEAGDMLKAADAKRKHIVLLSDGKSDGERSEFMEIAKNIAAARIGITTIAIGDAAEALLNDIADVGGGRTVKVQNLQELPKILMNTVRETQDYIVQEHVQPEIVHHRIPILEGIDGLPPLYGYVATAEKTAAQVFIKSHRKDEPLLAGWHYGLGKSVAWTSDVKPAWSKTWMSWANFGKFWGQVINWTLPADDADADFELIVSPRNGSAEVVIDAQRPSHLAYTVHVAGPNGTSETVEMQQVTSKRYSGTFRTNVSGSYIVTAKQEGDARTRTETLARSYPAEYADFSVNEGLLKTLSERTGGIYEPMLSQITAPAGTPIEKRVSMFQMLLGVAVALFVLEMILRRFSIASGYLSQLRAQLRGQQSERGVPETLTRLTQRKADMDTISERSVHARVETAVPRERTVADKAQPQSTEKAMTRLLAAKRKARAVSE